MALRPVRLRAVFGCALFAAALFIYVFYQPGEVEAGEEKTRLMYLAERKEATYENLRDLNFEYKAGKLSEQDYAVQRASLEDEAALILAEMESMEKARRCAARHAPRRRSSQRRPRVRFRARSDAQDRVERRRSKCGTFDKCIPSEDFSPSRGTLALARSPDTCSFCSAAADIFAAGPEHHRHRDQRHYRQARRGR